MYKPTLGLKEAANYYRSIRSTGWTGYDANDPLEEYMRRQGYDFFAPWVCGLSPDQEIDAVPRWDVLSFAVESVSRKAQETHHAVSKGYKWFSQIPSVRAEIVCEIMLEKRSVL
jgi:hypothetical protein